MAILTDTITERTSGAGVTIDGLLIKDGGLPDVPGAGVTEAQVTALAAYQSALAAATSGQVLTASGPGSAGFATPSASASLSDYQNVIVVDPGGNGDYTTLGAAFTAAADGDVIAVFGETTETGNIAIGSAIGGVNKKITIWLTPGSLVNFGAYKLFSAYDVTIVGNGTMTSTVPSAGTVTFYNGTLTLGSVKIENTVDGGYALSLESIAVTAKLFATTLQATGSSAYALNIVGPANLSADTLLHGLLIIGNVMSNTAWSNAPIYNSAIKGTVTNVTANAGTANGTNVVF